MDLTSACAFVQATMLRPTTWEKARAGRWLGQMDGCGPAATSTAWADRLRDLRWPKPGRVARAQSVENATMSRDTRQRCLETSRCAPGRIRTCDARFRKLLEESVAVVDKSRKRLLSCGFTSGCRWQVSAVGGLSADFLRTLRGLRGRAPGPGHRAVAKVPRWWPACQPIMVTPTRCDRETNGPPRLWAELARNSLG